MPAVALGARLLFVDIDPFTQSLSPELLSKAFDRWQIKAVIQAHLFGKAEAAEEVAALCKHHGAAYISDSAQLLGNSQVTSRLCELGACCFSFGESKLLRMGEGGAVATNSAALAERVRLVRHEGEIWRNRGESRIHNWEPSPWDVLYEIESVRIGLNYRPPAVLAALGSALLRELPQNTAKTRTNAEYLLAGLHGELDLELPSQETRTWWTFPVVLKDPNLRDTILAALLAEGIPVGVHFPRLMSGHQALSKASANANEELSGARLFADNHIVLPIFSSLDRQHMELIVAAARKTLSQNASVLSEMKLKSEQFLRTTRVAELCDGLFMYLH
jgi:dTDP-4-amino-4,6-dideoxygalactose transaminase